VASINFRNELASIYKSSEISENDSDFKYNIVDNEIIKNVNTNNIITKGIL